MKNLKSKSLLTMLMVLALLVATASMAFADFNKFLVKADDGKFYEYNQQELNDSYTAFQVLGATAPAAAMYNQFAALQAAGADVVALGDSVRGWMDYAAAQTASIAAQIAEIPFVINDFLALPASPPYGEVVTNPIVVTPAGETRDLGAYNTAVAEAATKVEADYTAATWADLQTALATVVTAANTQAEIDAAAGAINDAITALEPAVTEPSVTGVTATSAKALTVTFDNAISAADQAKITFATKRGVVNVSLTKTWAADGKSAQLAAASNLIAGDYTVTASGIEFGVNSATTTVEAVKASALTVESTMLNDATAKAKVDVKLADQYGTAMTLVSADFTATAFNVTQNTPVTLSFDGVNKNYYIDTAASADAFKLNDVVRVTFLHNATGLNVTDELTVVGAANLDTITFGDIELPTGKTMLTADLKNVKVPYVALDQFGNVFTMAIPADVLVVSSDETVLQAAKVSLVTENKITKIQVASFEKDGKATLTLMSKASGKTASVVFDVQKIAGAITTVTPAESSKTIAAASTGYNALEVADQYGTKILPSAYLNSFTIVSSNPAVIANNGDLAINNVAGTNYGSVKLVVLPTAAKDATTTITITDKTTGKQYATFVVVAGEKAVPTTVEAKATPVYSTTLVTGTNTTIKFNAVDQYGTALTSDVATYTIEYSIKEASNTNISLSATNTTLSGATVTVTGDKVGSATLVADLKKAGTVIDSREFAFTVQTNTSAGIKIADIPVLYKGGGAAYQEPVKVVTADGVALPAASIVSITSSNPAVVKVVGTNVEGVSVIDSKDTKATITVIYNADDKVVTLTKEVTVSAATLTVDSLLTLDKGVVGTVTTLPTDATAVTSINKATFAEFAAGDPVVFVVEKDNFARYTNSTATITVGNIVNSNVTGTDVTIAAGQLDFSALTPRLTTAAGPATFRVIATIGGKAAEINATVAGGSIAADVAAATDKVAAYEALDLTSNANIVTALASKAGSKEGSTAAVAALTASPAKTALTGRITAQDAVIDAAATIDHVAVAAQTIAAAAPATTANMTVTYYNASNVALTTALAGDYAVTSHAWTIEGVTQIGVPVNSLATTDLTPSNETTATVTFAKAKLVDVGGKYDIKVVVDQGSKAADITVSQFLTTN